MLSSDLFTYQFKIKYYNLILDHTFAIFFFLFLGFIAIFFNTNVLLFRLSYFDKSVIGRSLSLIFKIFQWCKTTRKHIKQ